MIIHYLSVFIITKYFIQLLHSLLKGVQVIDKVKSPNFKFSEIPVITVYEKNSSFSVIVRFFVLAI